jgi:signal transduction histidine kinase
MGVNPAPTPSMSPEELAGVIGAFNGVTARLQASHEALRSEVARLTQELSSANAQVERSRRLAALGQMAAGIAHEVRNPVACIRLYAGMLIEDLPDRPEERALAERIAAAVRTVDAIVGDVLTFAREFRLDPAEVDVSEVLDGVVEACMLEVGRAADDGRVRRLDRGKGLTLTADAGLLRQALVNVVRNSLEAMAEQGGGELTLDARAAAGESGPGVLIEVRDTGPGISPEVIPRIFNPFFTTRGTGTGLGLSIVHRIVDAHGGRITVRNNAQAGQGPGACVEVVLPNRPLAGARGEPRPARAAHAAAEVGA